MWRNMFMNCLRYAIEAGGMALSPLLLISIDRCASSATGFTVQEIIVRGPTSTALHIERLVPFGYFFDQAHFIDTLSTACPRMQLYSHQSDLWDKPSTAAPVHLRRSQLTSQFHIQAETVMRSAANCTDVFNDFLNSSHPAQFSVSRPVLVSLHTSASPGADRLR